MLTINESYRNWRSCVRRRGSLDKPSPYLCNHCLASITCTATPRVSASDANQRVFTRMALADGVKLSAVSGKCTGASLVKALNMSRSTLSDSSSVFSCSILYDSIMSAAKTAENKPVYSRNISITTKRGDKRAQRISKEHLSSRSTR